MYELCCQVYMRLVHGVIEFAIWKIISLETKNSMQNVLPTFIILIVPSGYELFCFKYPRFYLAQKSG